MTEDAIVLPDGSSCFTASMPLPKDHWLYQPCSNTPPMGLRLGSTAPYDARYRRVLSRHVQNAVRYAVRCATMNGQEKDFDPDALVQSAIIGLFGYHTDDGLSDDSFLNPSPVPNGYHGVMTELMGGLCVIPPLYLGAANDDVG